ncbi:hypothetical protein [Nostoc sp. TCL26-01]|uniref:hypothetical protein n=1 Tax=Nostoc sp. TCL26-01 TaxID=2576904 RepID=UPI0015B9344C|nr:hypothetical protein [Nostoc sp. TCL26-01]
MPNLPAEIISALREGQVDFTKARAIACVESEQHHKTLSLLLCYIVPSCKKS